MKRLPLAAYAATTSLPLGWFLAGSHPAHYAAGTDSVASNGKRSAYLASSATNAQGFGTLMQTANADRFRGKRIRMTASIQPEKVQGWAGMWLRADDANDKVLVFDNMQSRPIRGTSDWTTTEIVADIPADAATLSFGILLHGEGKVRIDIIRFEEVDSSVPVTAKPMTHPTLSDSQSLDFE